MIVGWLPESAWFRLLTDCLIKSTLALMLALILVLIFRRRSASLRHFILAIGLAGLLLLPILSSLGMGWETALLPAMTGAGPVMLSSPADRLPEGMTAGVPGAGEAILSKSGSSSARGGPGLGEQPSSRAARFLGTAFPFIWSAGLLFLLLRLAAGLFGAFRLTREGETVRDPRWHLLLERFLAAVHLRRKVRLKSHRDIRIPLTCGFVRPVVLIPDGHETWTEEQRSSTLIHELSHIKRADFLVMVLVRLSLAVFWFNPLSWVVYRRLKREQEEACDELALATGIKPSTYAANLLFFKSAAAPRLGPFAALLGFFGPGQSAFNERLAAILRQKWTFQEVKMKTKILLFCAVILAVALIGLARPSARAEAELAGKALATPDLGVSLDRAPLSLQETQAPDRGQEQGHVGEKGVQEEQPQEPAGVQEKEKQEGQEQKEQQKEKQKEPAIVPVKEGEKHALKIIITEGDKAKTFFVDKPVIVKEGKHKNFFILTPDGKEVKALDGKTPHLEIIGDKLEVIEEGKVVKIGKDGTMVYIVVKPDVHISEAVKIALKEIPLAVKAAEAVTARVTIEPGVEVEPELTPHVTWVAEDLEDDLREKLREIREKLKAAEEKKIELREVDEALADLEKELEIQSRDKSMVVYKHTGKADVFTIEPEKDHQEAAGEAELDVGVDIAEHSHKAILRVTAKDKGSLSMCYQIEPGENGREAYDRIVARVEKELPEGFTLEPKFEEKSGLITLKVKGPFGKEGPSDLVKKLADCIRNEAEKKP